MVHCTTRLIATLMVLSFIHAGCGGGGHGSSESSGGSASGTTGPSASFDLTGKWKGIGKDPDGSVHTVTATLQQNGNIVTGALTSPDVPTAPMGGTLQGQTLTYKANYEIGECSGTLQVSSDGATLTGGDTCSDGFHPLTMTRA